MPFSWYDQNVKTKYDAADWAMTANAIIAKESKRKDHVKYSRHYRFYYCEVTATFAGTPVKLFFYRNGKKGDWNALLSKNTVLGAYEAYKKFNTGLSKSHLLSSKGFSILANASAKTSRPRLYPSRSACCSTTYSGTSSGMSHTRQSVPCSVM